MDYYKQPMKHMFKQVEEVERDKARIENPPAGDEVDRLALEYQQEHGGEYVDALNTILRQRPDLKERYEVESFSESARAASNPNRR